MTISPAREARRATMKQWQAFRNNLSDDQRAEVGRLIDEGLSHEAIMAKMGAPANAMASAAGSQADAKAQWDRVTARINARNGFGSD